MLGRKHHFSIKSSLGYIIFFAIFLPTFSYFSPNRKILAEDLNEGKINQLSQQAETAYSVNQYQRAIELWLKLEEETNSLSPQKLALIQANIASALFQIGEYGKAIKHWHEAIAIYRNLKSEQLLATNLTNQAKAYLALGANSFGTKKSV